MKIHTSLGILFLDCVACVWFAIVTLVVNDNMHLWDYSVGALLNGLFWFVYTRTGNIVYGIGMTAAVSVAIVIALNMIGKRKLK